MDKIFTMTVGAACAAILTIGGFLIGKRLPRRPTKISRKRPRNDSSV